jgi:hypothetical protein
MEKKTSGAWVIHHTRKLQGVNLSTPDYEQINFAGKCGIVLNALAGSDERELNNEKLFALAKANSISTRLELSPVLEELQKQRLIDKGDTGIAILGLTSAQVLEYTADIFEGISPGTCEKVAIDISEKASDLPLEKHLATEFISDTYKISTTETNEILSQCEQIGFFDSESVSGEPNYFNGNLFRRKDITKVNSILHSLSSDDERHVTEITNRINSSGCIAKSEVIQVLGEQLYSKMCAIGFFDENSIGNEKGIFSFITRPAAFSKFTNSEIDDAFDLAKAFVTSLTYGMTTSPVYRGRITMIDALMRRLINGGWVGPATAIGQDYKVLEMKGVVEVRPAGGGLYHMRLLKKEVGQLALSVITEGEASTSSLLELPGVSATKYQGPEINRMVTRKTQAEPLKRGVAQLLTDLRTGEIK